MSFKTTNNRLIGNYIIKNHAINRIKERYPNKYIGNKKIKNCSSNRVIRYVKKAMKKDIKYVNEQDDGSLFIKASFFKAIVVPEFHNVVVTII